MKFAVVDIETTGLYHQGHGITEVAVVHMDGDELNEVFHSMINPHREIPRNITHLTGIDQNLVKQATEFGEIANELFGHLKDRIFVAHNANFDYHFLKAAFANVGIEFKPHRFCTMKYARRLLPHLKNHKLESVCNELNVKNLMVHRAGGDAMATAHVLKLLIQNDNSGIFNKLLNQNSGDIIIPAGLDFAKVEALPQSPGVYYFYGSDASKPLYIGKAIKLKSRVRSHFTSSGSTARQQVFQRLITNVEYKEAQNEYEALLLEDLEIKRYRPPYNIAQKWQGRAFAVVPYTNRQNQTRLGIIKTTDRPDALAWFNTAHEARNWLLRELIQREIDTMVAGIFLGEDYNLSANETKLRDFIDEKSAELSANFVLALHRDSKSYFGVVVKAGKYRGYGYFHSSDSTFSSIEKKMIRAPQSPVSGFVIRKMLQDENVIKQIF